MTLTEILKEKVAPIALAAGLKGIAIGYAIVGLSYIHKRVK